ncbi:MAG: hypothetical protein NTX27_22010 [Verrucomicrobia bacterium]|nr:hypothetical protein [Verrucomicrobiota bacterium]
MRIAKTNLPFKFYIDGVPTAKPVALPDFGGLGSSPATQPPASSGNKEATTTDSYELGEARQSFLSEVRGDVRGWEMLLGKPQLVSWEAICKLVKTWEGLPPGSTSGLMVTLSGWCFDASQVDCEVQSVKPVAVIDVLKKHSEMLMMRSWARGIADTLNTDAVPDLRSLSKLVLWCKGMHIPVVTPDSAAEWRNVCSVIDEKADWLVRVIEYELLWMKSRTMVFAPAAGNSRIGWMDFVLFVQRYSIIADHLGYDQFVLAIRKV